MCYVLITGASSGLGKELAIYLSNYYDVILNGRDVERLNITKNLCKKNVLIWNFDLSDYTNIESKLAQWIQNYDICISHFVHCAGFMNMTPIRSVTADILDYTFSINVFSASIIVKVLSSKKYNNRALKSCVFISSNVSNRGVSAFTTYGASKAALDGLMRNLSVELAPKIRVNSVLPGGMITEMTKDIFNDEKLLDNFSNNTPLGIGTPSDIAPVVEFLLSDKSRWITGQQITVDGGRTIDITERRNLL